jgi:hypothetical protein
MNRTIRIFILLALVGLFAAPSVNASEFSETAVVSNNPIKVGQNYPNPAIDKTFIEVDFAGTEATLSVYNVLGKLIETRTIVEKRIVLDVSEYTEGVYLYTVEVDGQKVTKRMTVKKR